MHSKQAGEKLFDAIHRKKGSPAALLKYKDQCVAALATARLPSGANQERFLEAAASFPGYHFVKNTNQLINFEALGLPPLISSALKRTLEAMEELAQLTAVATRSQEPLDYMLFLNRHITRPSKFLTTMPLYANGREVTFEDLPQDKAEKGEEMVQLIRDGGLVELAGQLFVLASQYSDIGADHEDFAFMFIRAHKALSALILDRKKAYTLLSLSASSELGSIDEIVDLSEMEDGPKICLDYLSGSGSAEDLLFDHGIFPYLRTDGDTLPALFNRSFSFGAIQLFLSSDPDKLPLPMRIGDGAALLADDEKTRVEYALHNLFNQITSICFPHDAIPYVSAAVYGAFIDDGADSQLAMDMLNQVYQKVCGLGYSDIIAPFRTTD